MRGILIDPFARQVREITLQNGGLEGIRSVIGDVFIECVSLGRGVDLWIDEEGMLNGQEKQAYFGLVDQAGGIKPLAGKGIVLGADNEGGTVGCPAGVLPHAIERIVRWLGDCWEFEAAIEAGRIERPMSCWHAAVGPDMRPTGPGEILWQWECPPRPEASEDGATPSTEG